MKSYRELDVWQKSMDVVSDVYELSREFPREEIYGLTQQLRRSAVSIPSNIAEGHGRSSTKDFLRHISIAMGSIAELETQLMLAQRLGFSDEEVTTQLLDRAGEVGRMMRGLQKSLGKRVARG